MKKFLYPTLFALVAGLVFSLTGSAQNAALTGVGAAAGMMGSPVTQPMDEFSHPDSDNNQSQ